MTSTQAGMAFARRKRSRIGPCFQASIPSLLSEVERKKERSDYEKMEMMSTPCNTQSSLRGEINATADPHSAADTDIPHLVTWTVLFHQECFHRDNHKWQMYTNKCRTMCNDQSSNEVASKSAESSHQTDSAISHKKHHRRKHEDVTVKRRKRSQSKMQQTSLDHPITNSKSYPAKKRRKSTHKSTFKNQNPSTAEKSSISHSGCSVMRKPMRIGHPMSVQDGCSQPIYYAPAQAVVRVVPSVAATAESSAGTVRNPTNSSVVRPPLSMARLLHHCVPVVSVDGRVFALTQQPAQQPHYLPAMFAHHNSVPIPTIGGPSLMHHTHPIPGTATIIPSVSTANHIHHSGARLAGSPVPIVRAVHFSGTAIAPVTNIMHPTSPTSRLIQPSTTTSLSSLQSANFPKLSLAVPAVSKVLPVRSGRNRKKRHDGGAAAVAVRLTVSDSTASSESTSVPHTLSNGVAGLSDNSFDSGSTSLTTNNGSEKSKRFVFPRLREEFLNPRHWTNFSLAQCGIV